MQTKKIASNIIYSLIVQIAGFISPLIISPYISRVLSAELIGDYSYVLANSSYFTLFVCLGLPLYGTLKVAKVRDDKEATSKIFWEIMILKFILTIILSVIYIIWFNICCDRQLMKLYWIMLINIVSSGIDVTWFLSGIEEFKITAIRTVVVRIINILLILVFVKSTEHLVIYSIIMQGATFVGHLAVYPTLFKWIKRVKLSDLNILPHIRLSFVYFVPGIINTIFSSADKTILGAFISNKSEVGMYEQANKICQLCLGMISAVSNAIMPRVAYLYSNGEETGEGKKLLKGSIRIAIFICFPLCLGIAAISDEFVPFFFGPGYEKSALLLKILCYNVLFISLTNFFGQQCLIARSKQKEYNCSVIISIAINILLNLALVHDMKSVGISIASIISAFVGLVFVLWFSRDMFRAREFICISKNYFIATIIMVIAIYPINFQGRYALTVCVKIVAGCVLYFLILVLLKDVLINKVCKRK